MDKLKTMEDFQTLMAESESWMSCDQSDELMLKYDDDQIMHNRFLKFVKTNYPNMNSHQRLMVAQLLHIALFEPSQKKIVHDIADLIENDTDNSGIATFAEDIRYNFFENMEEYE